MEQRYTIFAGIGNTGHLSFDEVTLKAKNIKEAKEKAKKYFMEKHDTYKVKLTHVSPWGESVQDLSKYEIPQDLKYFNQKVTFRQLFK